MSSRNFSNPRSNSPNSRCNSPSAENRIKFKKWKNGITIFSDDGSAPKKSVVTLEKLLWLTENTDWADTGVYENFVNYGRVMNYGKTMYTAK